MVSKSVKTWIKSIIIALMIASVSIVGGAVAYKAVVYSSSIMKQVNQMIKRPSYAYLKSVTVRIIQKTEKGAFIGTGSIIEITDEYTYILTNKHVAPMTTEGVYIIDEYSNKTKATVLGNCFFADLSLIRIDGKIEGKTKIKKIGQIDYSNNVYSVGMYLGYNYIYTQGTMAGYDRENNFVMNMPGAGGCSGSGVFNVEGELVAVVFAGNWIKFPVQVETAKLLCINTWDIKMFLYMNKSLIK